jgi:hypothetical protein
MRSAFAVGKVIRFAIDICQADGLIAAADDLMIHSQIK